MNREARNALLWLGALITGLAMVGLPGCSWGHREALAYDAAAREKIATEIAEEREQLADALEAVRESIAEADADLALELGTATACAERIAELAADETGRARIARLYHGTPPELEVELGNDIDRAQVVGMAGLAVNKQARREAPSKAVAGVAKFAAKSAAGIVHEMTEYLVPPWVIWLGVVVGLVIIGITVYAYYQKKIVIPRQRAELEQRRQALMEYDESMERALEGKTHEERKEIARGEQLKSWHETLKPIMESKPLPGLRIPIRQRERTPTGGVPNARDCMPGLRTQPVDTDPGVGEKA